MHRLRLSLLRIIPSFLTGGEPSNHFEKGALPGNPTNPFVMRRCHESEALDHLHPFLLPTALIAGIALITNLRSPGKRRRKTVPDAQALALLNSAASTLDDLFRRLHLKTRGKLIPFPLTESF